MKKYLLTFILSIAGLSITNATAPLPSEEDIDGIIVTYEGSDTSYKLVDMPTIKYETVEGVQHALLYMKDQTEPILNVVLAEGKKLILAYGKYVPTAIDGVATDKVTITERNGKKYINGGKLIIIGMDGKMYNIDGVEINK